MAFQATPISQGEALAAYRLATSYGNVFPCSICAGVFFDNEVVKATAVKQLSTAAGLGRFIHPIALDDEQFLAFGKRWCCKLCQTYLTSDKLPPLAVNNLLASPWLATPAVLHHLSPLERDLVTGFTPFNRVAHLQHGLTGRVPPIKTVHIVSSQAKGREISQVLGSFAVPPGYKFEVRLEETKSAHRYLLDVSKRHNTLLDTAYMTKPRRELQAQRDWQLDPPSGPDGIWFITCSMSSQCRTSENF